MEITAHISQFINKDAITAGAAGKRYRYSGFILLTITALKKKRIIIRSALISKKKRWAFSAGVINEINQLPSPITGGYSIEFVGDRYAKVLVSNPRSEKSAGISV